MHALIYSLYLLQYEEKLNVCFHCNLFGYCELQWKQFGLKVKRSINRKELLKYGIQEQKCTNEQKGIKRN